MHVYSKDEAQRIAEAFPADKLDELIELATSFKSDLTLIGEHKPISMPEGWVYQVYGNCIILTYQDGDQEREKYFVPRIWIEFDNVVEIEVKKYVNERLALGYCSCGKQMPLLKALLWATDMVERKSFWSLPSKAIGYTAGLFLGIYLSFSVKQQMSLQFNRHWSCL